MREDCWGLAMLMKRAGFVEEPWKDERPHRLGISYSTEFKSLLPLRSPVKPGFFVLWLVSPLAHHLAHGGGSR